MEPRTSMLVYSGVAAVLLAGAMPQPALAQAADEEAGLPAVKLQAFPDDPAAIPVVVMQERGIDAKHGFRAELMTVDPDVAFQTLLLGESDVATEQDVVTVSVARQEGHDTLAFYPVLHLATGIAVPADSPHQSAADLVGRRVGHFGIDSGTTTGIAAALAVSEGINVYEDFDLVQAGPAALPTLLSQGRVEAIFDFQPLLAQAVAETDGRYLFNPYEFWVEHFDGFSPWLTNLVARKDWLRENKDVAIGVRDAFAEAQKIIVESNYEILLEEPYASFLNLPSEQVLQEYVRYCQEVVPCFADGWSQDDRDKAQKYVALMQEQGLLVEEVPEEPVAMELEEFFAQTE
jgi:NitT/TauT family transport system substrate-binding protein